jgi:hypothetical protein
MQNQALPLEKNVRPPNQKMLTDVDPLPCSADPPDLVIVKVADTEDTTDRLSPCYWIRSVASP